MRANVNATVNRVEGRQPAEALRPIDFKEIAKVEIKGIIGMQGFEVLRANDKHKAQERTTQHDLEMIWEVKLNGRKIRNRD